MADDVLWSGDDNAGALYTKNGRRLDRSDMGIQQADLLTGAPAGAVAETFSRFGVATGNTSPLVSGRIFMTGIILRAGQVLNSATFLASSTAAVAPTNQWFCIANPALAVQRFTSDDLTTAWNASVIKTLAFTSPYTVPTDGLYYLGIMVAAGTPPTIMGATNSATTGGIVPKQNFASTTGQTTVPALPFSALDGAASTHYPWAYVS